MPVGFSQQENVIAWPTLQSFQPFSTIAYCLMVSSELP